MSARSPWPILGLLLLSAAIPAAMAQDPSAPNPSPTANVLYAHHHDSDTEELSAWMNTLVTDPTGNDVALGPTTVPCCPEARTYTITLAPALAGPIELDPAGNIVIDAYIGAGGSSGVVRVSTALTHGGAAVATGAAVNHPYTQSDTAAYPKVSWTIAPEITTLEAGKDLVWTVSLTGVAVQTVFLSVSAERGSSGITLPILTGGSASGGGNSTGNSTTNTTTSTSSASGTSSATSSSASTSKSSTTTSASTSESSSTSGNATNTTAGESKDGPAPPLALAALAVLVAAVAVRRRLR
jgi:MYXO-CTERM domain-containing protein